MEKTLHFIAPSKHLFRTNNVVGAAQPRGDWQGQYIQSASEGGFRVLCKGSCLHSETSLQRLEPAHPRPWKCGGLDGIMSEDISSWTVSPEIVI